MIWFLGFILFIALFALTDQIILWVRPHKVAEDVRTLDARIILKTVILPPESDINPLADPAGPQFFITFQTSEGKKTLQASDFYYKSFKEKENVVLIVKKTTTMYRSMIRNVIEIKETLVDVRK